MNDFELASALFSRRGAGMPRGTPYRVEGEARSDSSDGRVLVALSGDAVTGDGNQAVEMATGVSVKNGQTVVVTITDHKPMVTDVVGWGDLLSTEVTEASDKAEQAAQSAAGAVTESYEEYALSPSRTEAPIEGWSRDRPADSSVGVVWRRLVTVTGDGMATRSAPVPLTGEDGVTLSIEADGGTVLRNSAGSTTLRAVAYQGVSECRTLAEVRTTFGDGASVEWYELGPSGWVAVAPADPRLSEGGMALTAEGHDISGQATYRCCLVVIDENGVSIYGN